MQLELINQTLTELQVRSKKQQEKKVRGLGL